MATKHDIKYSSNSDPEKVAAEVTRLTDGQGRWTISATKSGVEREFKFKTFKTTWAFMNKVAEVAGKRKHHPEWSNVSMAYFVDLKQRILTRVGLQHDFHSLDYPSSTRPLTT